MLVNDMIAQALRLDPMIFIIDKVGSYKRICELFGGRYFRRGYGPPHGG